MKFNDKELVEASKGPAIMEGRLNHKTPNKSGFKERWFKLRCNLLFYFNISEIGRIDRRQPAGVIILENYSINIDTSTEGAFAFSITFKNSEIEKKHVLTARSESQVDLWVKALKQASYEYWRSQLIMLQKKLSEKTGKDPLLMYPRNQGVIRNEAWKSTSSFRSHVKLFTTSVTPTSSANTIPRETNLIEL